MPQSENLIDTSRIDMEFLEELRNLCMYSTSDESISVRAFMDFYHRERYGRMSDRTFYRILEGARPAPVSVIAALMRYTKSPKLLSIFATDKRLVTQLVAQVEMLRDMADTMAKRLKEMQEAGK